MLFVVLVVIAALMALSALGVEVGPLIAGAGVVGIAVGFGAQTLVKDVISGMFFLLDDAFRVGEYIESGSISGTVEAFSLRSIKLRHHRGALHTIPFGSLDKITNYSRDWVIDKITVSVTYDTDLDRVKSIIKQIGKELQDDPEYAPHILETLKMQGVEQFGDFAIQILMKMMTKPGEQFEIRHRAYALIKKAFDANAIKFAVPTVQVAGGGEAVPAAAQKGLELVQPASPAS
jgi:small-conductance mechanosensitive channel